MEWIFLLIAYLPIVSIIVGLVLLIAGLVVKKTDKKKATGLLKLGGLGIGNWYLLYVLE